MAIPQDPTKRTHATQRDHILAAARQVFARKGPAATMADIAQAAGVSQGLAYRYFAGKDQIYRELLAHAVQQAALATAPPLEAATPGQRLTLLITRLVEYRRDHLEIFQLLDQVLHADPAPTDVAAEIRARGAQFVAEVRALIVTGQATGEIAPGDPDQLVTALIASLDGLVRFGLDHPEDFAQRCPEPRIFLRLLGL